jgi:uncharacterized protein YegJ (DUF2314 family)
MPFSIQYRKGFTMRPIIIGIVIFLLGYLWTRYRETRSAGTVFKKDDPRLLAAKQAARNSLPKFWDAMERGDPANDDFVLKFNLNHGTGQEDNESIWAGDIKRRNGRIFGKLSNQPVNPDFREGQEVEIAPEAIDDWGYFRDGVAQGNYVTRLMIETAPPRVARYQKQVMGWA